MEGENKRIKFVGGNWKCKLTLKEAEKLIEEVYAKVEFDKTKVCKLEIFLF